MKKGKLIQETQMKYLVLVSAFLSEIEQDECKLTKIGVSKIL